jgi:hypothetical protein
MTDRFVLLHPRVASSIADAHAYTIVREVLAVARHEQLVASPIDAREVGSWSSR